MTRTIALRLENTPARRPDYFKTVRAPCQRRLVKEIGRVIRDYADHHGVSPLMVDYRMV